MPADDHLRILDASLNRATEGLRVVEDYARFVLDDAHLSRLLKELRHKLAAGAADALSVAGRHAMRDTPGDVGTVIATEGEATRADAAHVCQASCERVKQSLRSLEEFGKCADAGFAAACEALRYRFYAIESALGRAARARERLADANLYVLVDARASDPEFKALVEALVAAGVGAIQLRDNRLADADLLDRARQLVAACAGRVVSIVNDRPDIAAVAGTDGVHLGQNDLPVAEVRRIVGSRKLIGVSTHSIEQARSAVLAGADYLGAGPTFPSQTKSFEDFPGLAYLERVAAEISLPTFAIGGIDATNIGEVRATGIARAAVSAAVTHAADPRTAAEQLQKALVSSPHSRAAGLG